MRADRHAHNSEHVTEMDDRQFRRLLDYCGLSWQGYRKVRKGVKKRIGRHMAELGCRDMGAYLARVDRDVEARRACDRLLTVSISRFFRDRMLWQVLAEEILPSLVRSGREKIVVWVAGCASGEEAYSLKILWEELRTAHPHLPAMEITATDLNPQHLQRAKTGAYPYSSLKELPEELKFRYFFRRAGGKRFFVKALLKNGIVWKHHNFLHDPPAPRFNLVLLRNSLLTYYGDEIKMSALEKVVASLSDNGFLIIGSHEKLPLENGHLLFVSALSYVFRKG